MAAVVPSLNQDFLTPVDTTFKRMYLVSQDVFDEFKRFQDTNPPPGNPPSDPHSGQPPGQPPGAPPGGPPGGPPNQQPTSPLNDVNSDQQIALHSSNSSPQFDEEPGSHFSCSHKMNNGRPCNSKFDTQDHLDMHIQSVHTNHPLSQAAIRSTAESVDQDLHNSIDNETRISSTVKAQSHRNIANTILIQSDNTQCKLCSFKGQSPEDLDRHIRDDHVHHYYSISQSMLQPKINRSPKLTPKSISLNRVESYEQIQSRNNDQTMDDPTVEPVAGPSGVSNQLRRSTRGTRKKVEPTEPTRIMTRRNRGRLGGAILAAVDNPYPKRNPNKPKGKTKAQAQTEVITQPSIQTQKSKNKRTADVQQVELQTTLNEEEQKKNVFDLAVGRKKRKSNHTFQPPSKLWSTIPKKSKKKKRKEVKRITPRPRHTITARYKLEKRKTRRPKTKADPSIKRNVAALGLSGY